MTGIVDITSRLVKSHKELRVYQLSYSLSLEIHKATLEFPKIEQFALSDQMRRASKSICANIAEGFARQQSSDLEFGSFLQMAYSSAAEMMVWTDFAKDLGYISKDLANKWSEEFDKISRMTKNLKTKR